MYFAEKSESQMKFDVCKLGDPRAKCSVKYRVNPGPFERIKYEPVEGELIFDQGVATLSFFVPILQSGRCAAVCNSNIQNPGRVRLKNSNIHSDRSRYYRRL